MTKQFIQENLLTKVGGLNSARVKKLKETPEDLYLIYNNIEKPLCECGKNKKFYNFVKGYGPTCGDKACRNKVTGKLSKKAKIEKYGYNFVNSGKAMETREEKYGSRNHHIEKMLETKKTDIDEFGKNAFQRANEKAIATRNSKSWKQTKGKEWYNKVRKTQELSGNWIKLDSKKDFELYKMIVWKMTKRNDLSKLANIDKRGMINVEEAYHLDHKISIKYGFENNIPCYIIADIENLEMIPAMENIIKASSCKFA